MSFIKRFRKNGRTYLAEVESYRVGKKVKTRFLRYVGRESDGKTVLSCSISEAEIKEVRLAGPLMVLHSLADSIGLPALLGEYANEILALTYAHCMDYESLNRMQEWFERTDLGLILNLEKLTEKRLVNALDHLQKVDAMALQLSIFENTKKFLHLKTRGVVYDVTNTYFHGRRCKLAHYGHDKEQRKGYPLIQIGLGVTAERGIPVLHKTFPGNIHDSRTFLDLSNDLMKFNIHEGLAVMDRGITSAENTRFLRENNWHALCGMKRNTTIEKALGPDFNAQDLERPQNRVCVQQTAFYGHAIPFVHGGCKGRLIACFNKRAALDKQEARLDKLQKAQALLRNREAIDPELRKLLDKDGRPNERRLNAARRWDGMSFIFATAPLSIGQAIKAYFDKDVVEKCFQELKGVVRLRPVRQWLRGRVVAHVFICYLACLLLSILKVKVAPLDLSFQEALDALEGLYRVYLRDPKTGFSVGRLVALTKQQESILRAVDKRLVKKCAV